MLRYEVSNYYPTVRQLLFIGKNFMVRTPPYDKLLDPIRDVNHSIEGLLNDAFGKLSGDQREGLKHIYANTWGLYTLFMDVVTSLGIENIAQRNYLREKFAQHADPMVTVTRALLDGMDGPLTEEQAVSIEFIHETGHLLRQCIDRLWLYSQLEHKQIKPDVQILALDDILDPLQLPVTDALIMLDLQVPHHALYAQGDLKHLHWCLNELVQNAIQATDSGAITIRTEDGMQADEICIIVEDTGRGISPKYRKKIYDSFFQIDPIAPGLGLGLHLVSYLLRLTGSRVHHHSQLGRGARFTLSLIRATPVADASQ